MEFENSGVGRCVILKDSDIGYTLIYSIRRNQFIVVSDLDKDTGSWLHGRYFDEDLDSALSFFNDRTQEKTEEYER